MCVAVVIRAGTTIILDEVKNCMMNNPDGFGFMYALDGKLWIYRTMEKDSAKFYAVYLAEKEKAPDAAFVMHFRIGTHGEKNIRNCHPFVLKTDPISAFVHNGIFQGVSPLGDDDGLSDTYWFGEKCLSTLPPEFWNNGALNCVIDRYVSGKGSKIVLLTADGKLRIYGEDLGVWDDGRWFSNKSYLPYKLTYKTFEFVCETCKQPGLSMVQPYKMQRCHKCREDNATV